MSRWMASLCVLLPLAGCGVPDWWLGAEQGTLFQGFDAVVRPGEPATLRISLRGGKRLAGLSDYTIFLYDDARRRIGVAKTDAQGDALFTVTQPEPGLYRYQAEVDQSEVGAANVPTAMMQAGVFDPQTRFLFIDLDGTIVGQGFDMALLADSEPMPHAREVIAELAPRYQPLYLTGRPEYLGRRSRQWLQDHHLPPGPLIVSRVDQYAQGVESYRKQVIGGLQKSFPQKHAAIGDKPWDIRAYAATGVTSLLIVQTQEESTRRATAALIKVLKGLPPQTHVVTDWLQVRQVLMGQASYPLEDMLERLESQASGEPDTRDEETTPEKPEDQP